MSVYAGFVVIGLAIYVLIGYLASKKVKSLDDYYVSGRNASTLFIAGTMFASMLSTNGFMGDVGYAYDGNISILFLINVICACGYILGPIYFGRYIRRVKSNTMPGYFRARFNSKRIGKFAGIVLVTSLFAYLLSVLTGVSILMQSLLGLNQQICLLISWIAILLFTLSSGSKGVIIIDTLMCICFLTSTIFVGYYVLNEVGGTKELIFKLATNPAVPDGTLSYHGQVKDSSIFHTLSYGLTLGIIWLITVSVSPWQAGRNLMAKSEHTIFRSGVISALLTIFFLIFLYIVALGAYELNANIARSEEVLIWICYEVVPTWLGAFLLTGIMSAGLSSATTFLSVISFSLANDIFSLNSKNQKAQLKLTKLFVILVSLLALVLAYFNLASIRIIAWFASTIIAASWGVVAFGSVWSKKLSESGAYYSMLFGFVGYLLSKALNSWLDLNLWGVFDPFFIGIYASLCAALIGSFLSPLKQDERDFLASMHILPQDEKSPKEYRIDMLYAWFFIASAGVLFALLVYYWIVPYHKALGV